MPSYRLICPRCRRPEGVCLCPSEPPMHTRTKIVLLTHPKEWKRQNCGTGRLLRLNIEDVEILPGLAFDSHPRVTKIVNDPEIFPVLVYPGEGAADISSLGAAEELARAADGRRIAAFLIDATWSCSKAVLRASPGLLSLPRIMFTPAQASRWVIKRQPGPMCLSTLETVHELLAALDAAGLDSYPDRTRLIDAFVAMQAVQVEKARARYVRYKEPG
ncbi:MAG TPA: tRNA-uridine aminocarboxypropyltransferase [Rectinemataceae bacterium]